MPARWTQHRWTDDELLDEYGEDFTNGFVVAAGHAAIDPQHFVRWQVKNWGRAPFGPRGDEDDYRITIEWFTSEDAGDYVLGYTPPKPDRSGLVMKAWKHTHRVALAIYDDGSPDRVLRRLGVLV